MMQALEELRQELEEKRENLLSRLGKINHHLRQKGGPLSADWEEQAQELENDEVLQALDSTSRQELKQIQHALSRMDAGTYGECTECGNQIKESRLRALPYTTLCIDCANEAERT